jgi:hypothetical protein
VTAERLRVLVSERGAKSFELVSLLGRIDANLAVLRPLTVLAVSSGA